VYGTNIFAATRTKGVFLSTDNGATWTPINEGLKIAGIWSLEIIGTDLFAGTYGRGVWRMPLNVTSIEKPRVASLSTTKLKIVASNWSRSTMIATFSLLRPEWVTVAVYDFSGRTLATLIDGQREAGEHELSWKIRDIPAGFYILRMRTPTINLTKSFPLVR
jgi:hypothetical protein